MRIDEMVRSILRPFDGRLRALERAFAGIPARFAAPGGGAMSLPKGQRGMVLQIIDDNNTWDAEYPTFIVLNSALPIGDGTD